MGPLHYPLMFTYKDCIAGNGFLAGVKVSGRALMLEEDSEWWMYGVRPAAIAETGKTPEETSLKFRESYTKVLFDFASDAKDFENFEAEVHRFFNERETEIETAWEQAFQLIRNGEVTPEPPFSLLPRTAPEARQPTVNVIRIENTNLISASENAVPKYEIPEKIAA